MKTSIPFLFINSSGKIIIQRIQQLLTLHGTDLAVTAKASRTETKVRGELAEEKIEEAKER